MGYRNRDVKTAVSTSDVALVGVMAALANVLGFVALRIPLMGGAHIDFTFAAVPILLVAFTRGPLLGAVTGLIGGIGLSIVYGHIAYVIYTAILGGVAGLMARNPALARRAAPFFFAAGGFFLTWWIDQLCTVLRLTGRTFTDFLKAQSQAPGQELYDIFAGISPAQMVKTVPVVALAATVIAGIVGYLLAKRAKEGTVLALAGCMGAIAYVPWDAFVLIGLQHWAWLISWFILAKDLVQDFLASWITSRIALSKRVRRLLGGGGHEPA